MQRSTLALTLGAALAAVALGPVAPADSAFAQTTVGTVRQQANDRFQVHGKILEVTHAGNGQEARAILFDNQTHLVRAATDPNGRPYASFLTSDINGQPTTVVLDLSWLKQEGMDFVDLDPPVAAEVLLDPRPNDTYLAVQYGALATGSDVNNTDWGIQERWTTRDDSINARTDNGPDDDEARAQDHNEDEEDDDDN